MSDAQQRIAHDCRTTVLTLADPALHTLRHCPRDAYGNVIERVIAELDGHANDIRYDLLALARPEAILARADTEPLETVVADIRTAVSLHNGERLIVASHLDAGRLIKRLRSDSQLRRSGLKVIEARLPKPKADEGQTTLIITCMDWRLHGTVGGLIAAAERTYGAGTYGLLTTAGGAMELARNTPRRRVVFDQIKAYAEAHGAPARILLASHTDCGKYGGDSAFKHRSDQIIRLTEDLYAAAGCLRATLGPKVETAIAELEHDQVASLKHPVSML